MTANGKHEAPAEASSPPSGLAPAGASESGVRVGHVPNSLLLPLPFSSHLNQSRIHIKAIAATSRVPFPLRRSFGASLTVLWGLAHLGFWA